MLPRGGNERKEDYSYNSLQVKLQKVNNNKKNGQSLQAKHECKLDNLQLLKRTFQIPPPNLLSCF